MSIKGVIVSELQKILCVDDEPDIRTVLVAALSYTLNVEVVAMESAMKALEYLAASSSLPDVIILDGQMPVMSGVDACKAIREVERYGEIPIVFLSANSRRDMRRAMEAGATACLQKPFDPMTIGNEIRVILERQS